MGKIDAPGSQITAAQVQLTGKQTSVSLDVVDNLKGLKTTDQKHKFCGPTWAREAEVARTWVLNLGGLYSSPSFFLY